MFILAASVAVFSAPNCPGGAKPFEGTGRAATESKARENANSDIARLFSTIKVDILDELTQRETSDGIKEYANYQRKIKVEGGLYAGYIKDTEYPYPKENGQFVAKRYLCPNDAAKPYLDSLKIINQRVAIQKVNNSFCESLYKTYSPKVVFFERILERLGETAQVAEYKKVEKECDDLRGSIRKGFVGFEEALDKAVAEIISKRGKIKTKIVIAEIYASVGNVADFITTELENKLVKVKSFDVVEPVNIFNEQTFKIGPMKYADARVIGKSSKADVVIVGSFDPYEMFSHFMIKAIEVQGTKTLAMHTDKIRPNDDVLSFIPDKLPAITDDALAYLNKGEDLYRERKYDEAIREFDKALAINKNLANGYYFRGSAYFFKNDPDRALADYNTALKIKPDFYQALSGRGVVYAITGNKDRAIEDFNAALRIKPNDPEALLNRGATYKRKGNYDLAIEDFNATLRIRPDEYVALSNRCATYGDKGNYDRAIEDCNAALRIKPDFYEALYNRGIAYADKGNYDRAIDDYNAALKIKPDYHEALSNRGLAYYNKGNYNRAIEDYNAALKIEPYDEYTLNNRGAAHAGKGNYDRAIEDYTAALRIEPDDVQALKNRGLAYAKKGNYDQAIDDWEAVLRIEPNNASVKKNLEIVHQEKSSKNSPNLVPSMQPTTVPSGSATLATLSLKDTRDNKTYKVVKIGTQIWMAENLNYNASGSKCYDNKESNCQKYGRLYNLATAKKACPSGWHLPSDTEWDILMVSVGGKKTAGNFLKATSGWNNNGNGQDKYGFSALPGGYGYSNGSFNDVGRYGYWLWSCNDNACYRTLNYNYEYAGNGISDKSDLFSVRCVKD
jgi:uncharacterized protein (TIGR02145 family)